MTRSRIDRKVVRDRLELASSCIADLRAVRTATLEAFVADRRNPAAADSLLRRAIEALFDTTRHILAKEYGVGALEYREVARQAGGRSWPVELGTPDGSLRHNRGVCAIAWCITTTW